MHPVRCPLGSEKESLRDGKAQVCYHITARKLKDSGFVFASITRDAQLERGSNRCVPASPSASCVTVDR